MTIRIGKKRRNEFSRMYEENESDLICPICDRYIHYGILFRERMVFNEELQEWCHERCVIEQEEFRESHEGEQA